MAAVVKEDLPGKDGQPGEVAAFREGFWPGLPVFLDEERAFYDALGGGAANATGGVLAFLAKLANPWNRLKKNARRAGNTQGNMVGEGFVHGGCYVVRAGAAAGEAPALAHAETVKRAALICRACRSYASEASSLSSSSVLAWPARSSGCIGGRHLSARTCARRCFETLTNWRDWRRSERIGDADDDSEPVPSLRT